MINNEKCNKLFDTTSAYLQHLELAIHESEENTRKLRAARALVMREILGQDPQKRQIPVADRPAPATTPTGKPWPKEKPAPATADLDPYEGDLERKLQDAMEAEMAEEAVKAQVSPPQPAKQK